MKRLNKVDRQKQYECTTIFSGKTKFGFEMMYYLHKQTEQLMARQTRDMLVSAQA